MPILHVGRNTVYELVRSNQIRGIKVGKQIRVLKTDVLQFLGCQEPSIEAG
ncbi:DNA-binding protein [bacterium 1xD42-67]|nr:DNA-binding protein [bacterium 1xD42-67]